MSFLKNKNKSIFVLVIFFWLVSIASFFIWGKICKAEPILKITNVQFSGGAGKTDEDFIEITNTTENELNLNEYKLVKKTSSGTRTSIVSFSNEDSIPPEKTYLWASSENDDFPKKIGADIWREETISENNGIAIILGNKDTGVIIDSLNWKKEDEPEDEDVPPEETADYSKIRINEIYPAPNTKEDEEEFVEIINESEKTPDFSDWTIKDSKGAKGKISRHEKDGAFIVFYGSFSLNNDSKGDTVFLYDKKDALIASQKYATGKTAYSYSFDGSAWRWTPHITPGADNEFAEILSGKIKKDKTIYAGVYANFEVSNSKKAKKFTWNFGDGHKSYLKKTRHKYEKTGKYTASLKITGDGEDNLIEFEIKVEKYNAPKVRIISLSANPKGSDTKNEWIEIENKSKKKVNLKGWSIATGWKKFINHPIREDFEIKPGKSKKLLRDICAFSLTNTKNKLELRSPDGKTIQDMKYNHKDASI
ncbi:MAG: lamin tail domain-containing protein, partial [Candidatus Moraniibacteriota bacterium]